MDTWGLIAEREGQAALSLRARAIRRALAAVVALLLSLAPTANTYSASPTNSTSPAAQSLFVLPDLPVAVAPNQPEVLADSTRGIINALCDVTLNIVGCGFMPTSIKITCDTNGDGVPELMIPLTDITLVNRLLIQAVIPALSPQLPGTPFPLACCGGPATLTLSRTLSAAPDNIFGDFTQSLTCPIDLGERAPVVISATPSGGDCSIGQNLLIPGSCFVRADGTPNVTSVFAVERGNPNNVIQSTAWQILGPNLIDAFFTFGSANAGRTFLIHVSGPNGTSRNLTELPPGAPAGCPLGNEQGVQVTFTCQGGTSTPAPPAPPSELNLVSSCSIERSSSGATTLILTTNGISGDADIRVGGVKAKKLKFMDQGEQPNTFGRVVVKGKVCKGLPGLVAVTYPDGRPVTPFMCAQSCTP